MKGTTLLLLLLTALLTSMRMGTVNTLPVSIGAIDREKSSSLDLSINKTAATIEELIEGASSIVVKLLESVTKALILIARSAYVTFIILGLVSRFTRINRRLGDDLIKGGILLAILIEIIIPILSMLHYT